MNRKLFLIAMLSLGSHSGTRLIAEGFPPDSEGWIRHWIVYGPIGVLPEDDLGISIANFFHPFTFEPMIGLDLIAEPAGTAARQTQGNFLPAPGREISTEFGALLPSHELRRGYGPGLNPNGRLAGIAWADSDCTVNFDNVFNFQSPENDGAGTIDIRNYVAYAYAYVEYLAREEDPPLVVHISLASDDAVEVLLGKIPEMTGADFMRPVFLLNILRGAGGGCIEQNGPAPLDPQAMRFDIPVLLWPGLNLLLVKVLDGNAGHAFRFRFRHQDPEFRPVTGETIRIRLGPDLSLPEPTLFRRMDANQDGEIDIADPVSVLETLFLGDEPLPCSDAADSNDDGSLDIADPVHMLLYLFAEGFIPAFPKPPSCGLDPTEDALPECRSDPLHCH